MISDGDGRVAVFLQLGPDEGRGNNVVQATFDGSTGMPAQFAASGLVAGNPAQTSVTGVVLDNSNLPIPGVTMHLLGLSQGTNGNVPIDVVPAVQTDSQGQFTLTQAPIGVFKLMADGTTAAVQEPRNSDAGIRRDDGGRAQHHRWDADLFAESRYGEPDLRYRHHRRDTHASGLAGFSLTVAPGSATFPGGSRSGLHQRDAGAHGQDSDGAGLRAAAAVYSDDPAGGNDVQSAGQDDASERGRSGAAGGDRDVFLRSRPGGVRGDRHGHREQ